MAAIIRVKIINPPFAAPQEFGYADELELNQ